MRSTKPEDPFDVCALAVGGGGPTFGVEEGLARNGLHSVPMIAVETDGATSLTASLATEKLMGMPAITGIATPAGARKASEHVLQICRKRPIESVVVDDRSAVEASFRFMDDHRIVVGDGPVAASSMVLTKPTSVWVAMDQLMTKPSKQSMMSERYTLPPGIWNSLMSVSHFTFGAFAWKSRLIRLSGTGLISPRYDPKRRRRGRATTSCSRFIKR